MKIEALDKIFEKFRDKSVVLWGITDFGLDLLALFRKEKIEVIAFCDNNSTKWNTEVEGLIVISPDNLEQLDAKRDDICVLITNVSLKSCDEISSQLELIGIKDWRVAKKTGLDYYMMPLKILDNLTPDTVEYEQLRCNAMGQSIQLQRQANVWQAIAKEPKNLVLLCLPPKTGDGTLNRTLRENNINYINLEHRTMDFDQYELYDSPIKIITAVREPIIPRLSAIYQNISLMGIHGENIWGRTLLSYILVNKETSSIEDNINRLKNNLLKDGLNIQDVFDMGIYVDKQNHPNNEIKTPIGNWLEGFVRHVS